MLRVLLCGFVSFLCSCLFAQTTVANVYDLSFNDFRGSGSKSLSDFKGKKILIINTGSAGDSAVQLNRINQRIKNGTYKNTVVLVCPSNSFGGETKTPAEVLNYYKTILTDDIYVSVPISVKGENIDPLFKWLTSKKLNGVMDVRLTDDFCKFLISETGAFIGFFTVEAGGDETYLDRILTDM